MSDKLYIYTEEFFILPRLKNMVKRFIGKTRGPEAVFQSLIKGLNELNISFSVNNNNPPMGSVAGVLSGCKTLRWVILKKQAGVFKKIIAGPNLIVRPDDSQGLIKNPSIDRVIVPSEWVKEFYIKLAPQLASKIQVWAAGVDVFERQNNLKTMDFLVFEKTRNLKILSGVIDYIKSQGFKVGSVRYGSFSQKEFFYLLERSKILIYLSPSESQGFAMFEAWARDVPTLVFESGIFESDGVKVEGKVSAPYLTDLAGMPFSNLDEFKKILPEMLKLVYNPKEYVLKDFTHKICAQKYLDVIKNCPMADFNTLKY